MDVPDEITFEQIRARAYELWERHHRPEGFEIELWLMAERELRVERERRGERESRVEQEGLGARPSDASPEAAKAAAGDARVAPDPGPMPPSSAEPRRP